MYTVAAEMQVRVEETNVTEVQQLVVMYWFPVGDENVTGANAGRNIMDKT